MESIDLEKQVETLLATPQFEQPQFEQNLLKDVFSKSMLVSAVGTSLSVQLGNAVGRFLPIGQLPVGTSSILAGILMQKFGGSNKLLKDLSLGIIQGGIATAMTPFTSGLIPSSFNQEVKETTEELNPMMKGVMW
jgi:hypothetical protein